MVNFKLFLLGLGTSHWCQLSSVLFNIGSSNYCSKVIIYHKLIKILFWKWIVNPKIRRRCLQYIYQKTTHPDCKNKIYKSMIILNRACPQGKLTSELNLQGYYQNLNDLGKGNSQLWLFQPFCQTYRGRKQLRNIVKFIV